MQCRQGNASVAAIAQAHDIHANLLRRWVREQALRDLQQTELATADTPVAPPTKAATTGVAAAGAQAPASTAQFIEITPSPQQTPCNQRAAQGQQMGLLSPSSCRIAKVRSAWTGPLRMPMDWPHV